MKTQKTKEILYVTGLLAALVMIIPIAFREVGAALGAPAERQVESAPAALPAETAVELPSGAVMLFNLSACPAGWSELTAARGRYLVGLPEGGTLAGTKGAALANLEDRPVGQHTHTITDIGHTHTISDPGHGHTLTDPGHAHLITDPGHRHNLENNHDLLVKGDYAGDRDGDPSFADWNIGEPYSNNAFTGITVNQNITGITLASNSTGISILNNTTGITIDNAGAVSGTNAPYIQLLVCQKD